MTHTPDEPDDPAEGAGQRGEGAGRKLDEDAAWREIIAHYDEATAPDPVIEGPVIDPRETADPDPPATPGSAAGTDHPLPEAREERLRGLFRPGWDDAADPAELWEDEEHFVPPAPPPLPAVDPRRRLAWAGLFGSPMLMVLDVVLGWRLPDWLLFLMAASFAGGFVYLVATMPKRPGDGPGGPDDGAVV